MAALAASGVAGPRCLCIDTNGDGSYAICGNGTAALQEDCDRDELEGETCASLGFGRGELSCGFCTFDTSRCVRPWCRTTGLTATPGPPILGPRRRETG